MLTWFRKKNSSKILSNTDAETCFFFKKGSSPFYEISLGERLHFQNIKVRTRTLITGISSISCGTWLIKFQCHVMWLWHILFHIFIILWNLFAHVMTYRKNMKKQVMVIRNLMMSSTSIILQVECLFVTP